MRTRLLRLTALVVGSNDIAADDQLVHPVP